MSEEKESQSQATEEVFDLDLQEMPIKVRKNGVVHTYKIRELKGKDREAWMSGMAGRMRLDTNGKPIGLKNFDGLHGSLVCRCLFDDEGKLVTMEEFQSWPGRVQHVIFTKTQKFCALDDLAVEREKNS